MIEISIYLRVLLVLGSISTAAFILKRIRQAKVQIEDCIFWLFFAAFLLLLSIFPEVASWVSRLLEFESPITPMISQNRRFYNERNFDRTG